MSRTVNCRIYDAAGLRLTVRDANGVGQDCTYDELGRRTVCQDTQEIIDTVQRSWLYDLAGNQIQATDAKGGSSTNAYDPRGRRTSSLDRNGSLTVWAYDLNSNLLTLTDGENQTTTYTYDIANRRLSEQYPDHIANTAPGDADYGIVAFAYDAARQRTLRTDQLGDTCTTTYDLAGRRAAKAYRTRPNSPSGAIADTDAFTYDAASRLVSAASGRYNNTVSFTFDNAGRLSTEALTVSGQTYTIARGYDAASRMTQLTYPDGSIVNRTYTNRNQLAQVDYNTSLAASFIYDAGQRETSRTFGNNLTTTRTYRADNLTATIDTPTVTSFAYTYDANKNKTSETISGVMSPYGFLTTSYDNQDRLTAWNRTDGALNQSWNLSKEGDWNSFTQNTIVQNRTHGPTHELTAIDSVALTHDSKGNLTTNSNTQSYAWDFDNRMSQTIVPSGAPGLEGTHTYSYDALGRRVSKSVDTDADGTPDQTTVFVCKTSPLTFSPFAGQVLAEYASGQTANNPSQAFIYVGYIDGPLMAVGPTQFYYHQDRGMSTIALTDTQGAVVEYIAYSPYGRATIASPSGTVRATSVTLNRFAHASRRIDMETELYYYRSRYYNSEMGRFLSRDPIGFLGSPYNFYQFLRSNPARYLDPNGLCCKPPKPPEPNVSNVSTGGFAFGPPNLTNPDTLDELFELPELIIEMEKVANLAKLAAKYGFSTAEELAKYFSKKKLKGLAKKNYEKYIHDMEELTKKILEDLHKLEELINAEKGYSMWVEVEWTSCDRSSWYSPTWCCYRERKHRAKFRCRKNWPAEDALISDVWGGKKAPAPTEDDMKKCRADAVFATLSFDPTAQTGPEGFPGSGTIKPAGTAD